MQHNHHLSVHNFILFQHALTFMKPMKLGLEFRVKGLSLSVHSLTRTKSPVRTFLTARVDGLER